MLATVSCRGELSKNNFPVPDIALLPVLLSLPSTSSKLMRMDNTRLALMHEASAPCLRPSSTSLLLSEGIQHE